MACDWGNIVISNTKSGIGPAAIRFFTGSRYSHSFLTIPSILGTEMALEAAGAGVSAIPFNSGYRNNSHVTYKVYQFKAPESAKQTAIKIALEKLQAGYGYLETPWFAWRAVNKWFGRDIRGRDNWYQRGIICSEYTSEYISDCGYSSLFDDFGKGSVNAQDIDDICSTHPDLFELTEVKDL